MKIDKKQNQYRINEQIHVREVRIVGEDGSSVMPTKQALDMAHQQGVDLVEISPNANPPVCRLIDYSKFLYQQKKRAKEMKAKQVKVEVKEIRFGPQTDEHDYQFKLKHAKEFLDIRVLQRSKHPFQGAGRGAVAAFCQRSGRGGKGRVDALARRQEDVPLSGSEESRCRQEEPAGSRP